MPFHLVKRVDVLDSRLVLHYGLVTYGCRPELAYLLSQQWLVWPAVRVHQLRYEPGFDLRALGIVQSALFGVAFAALHRALPGALGAISCLRVPARSARSSSLSLAMATTSW